MTSLANQIHQQPNAPAITLRWIMVLVFPFNTLPERAGCSSSAEPDKVYDNFSLVPDDAHLANLPEIPVLVLRELAWARARYSR